MRDLASVGGCGGFGFVLVRNCAWTEKLWLLMTMCRMGYITICTDGKCKEREYLKDQFNML